MSPAPWLVPGPLHAVLALLLACWLLGRVRPRPPRWLRRTVLFLTAWAWIGATPALGNLLARHLEDSYPAVALRELPRQESGVIVVLASGQMFRPDGRPRPVLDADGWERLRAGIALWRQVGGRLVLAGGPGEGPEDSFAWAMQQVALDAGIPADNIQRVGGSRNTREDLLFVARELRAREGQRVVDGSPKGWLVTSALHMPRAAATARTLGLDLAPFPCGHRHLSEPSWRSWLPDNGEPALWRDSLHELLGAGFYRLRGWDAE